MTELFTFSDQTWLRQRRDDGEFGKATARSDGVAPESGQVVTIATADFLDEVELAQSSQVAGDAGIGLVWQKRFEVGTTESPEVEFGTLQRPQQSILGTVEEVEALEGVAIDVLRPHQFAQGAVTGGKVVQCRKILHIPAVAAEQNGTEIDQAVDGFLEGGELPLTGTVPVFHVTVVLEKGNVIGRGLDAEYPTELVVHLDRGLAESMLDAGALDSGGKLATEFLGQLRRDLSAKKARDLFRFDGQDGLPGQGFIKRLQCGSGAEHQVGSVFRSGFGKSDSGLSGFLL